MRKFNPFCSFGSCTGIKLYILTPRLKTIIINPNAPKGNTISRKLNVYTFPFT